MTATVKDATQILPCSDQKCPSLYCATAICQTTSHIKVLDSCKNLGIIYAVN